ncbi:MAG: hypothetical protein ACFCVH_11455 [Alphaproteobacteria bacterium]
MSMITAAAAFNRTIHSKRSTPHLVWGILAVLFLASGVLTWIALWGAPGVELFAWTTDHADVLRYTLPAIWALLLSAAWWFARAGRRIARVVAVDGDIVTITLGSGVTRRWDMNLAQRVRCSRYGADIRFSSADRMWIPWAAFAERDRHWLGAYLDQLQVRLSRRQTRAERPMATHD